MVMDYSIFSVHSCPLAALVSERSEACPHMQIMASCTANSGPLPQVDVPARSGRKPCPSTELTMASTTEVPWKRRRRIKGGSKSAPIEEAAACDKRVRASVVEM